jgi:hypothetical protein
MKGRVGEMASVMTRDLLYCVAAVVTTGFAKTCPHITTQLIEAGEHGDAMLLSFAPGVW